MNPQKTSSQPAVSIEKNDAGKLVSLLALATSAIAFPQTSNADIIFFDHTLTPVSVGFGADSSFTISNLPGNARVRFAFGRSGASIHTSTRFIQVGEAAGYVRLKTHSFFVIPAAAGMRWDDVAGNVASVASAGAAHYSLHFPDSYSSAYFLFRFMDSSHANALRYGWVNVGLVNDNLSSSQSLRLTIFGWAYDDSGAQITTGAVPEPSSAAVLALGAMALGSKGLRSWRRNRVNKS